MATYLRARVPDELALKFKVHCAKQRLSFAKQLSLILKNYMELVEHNERMTNKGN